MRLVLIGNLVSLIAACFMVASCLVHSKRRTFFCQTLECSILAAASLLFFHSPSGAATLIISAVRNLLVARDRFTLSMMWLFLFLTLAIGLPINTRGIIGLLPIFATLEYTLCAYYVKGVLGTKVSIFVNTLLWVIYSFWILDFSTALTDLVVLGVDLAAIVRLHRAQKAVKDA